MANLKLDLKNKLSNDKYYEELELVRLAQDPNTNYKVKVDEMAESLKNLVIFNAQLALIDQYFQEPVPQPVGNAQAVNQIPQGQVHPGQTHGE